MTDYWDEDFCGYTDNCMSHSYFQHLSIFERIYNINHSICYEYKPKTKSLNQIYEEGIENQKKLNIWKEMENNRKIEEDKKRKEDEIKKIEEIKKENERIETEKKIKEEEEKIKKIEEIKKENERIEIEKIKKIKEDEIKQKIKEKEEIEERKRNKEMKIEEIKKQIKKETFLLEEERKKVELRWYDPEFENRKYENCSDKQKEILLKEEKRKKEETEKQFIIHYMKKEAFKEEYRINAMEMEEEHKLNPITYEKFDTVEFQEKRKKEKENNEKYIHEKTKNLDNIKNLRDAYEYKTKGMGFRWYYNPSYDNMDTYSESDYNIYVENYLYKGIEKIECSKIKDCFMNDVMEIVVDLMSNGDIKTYYSKTYMLKEILFDILETNKDKRYFLHIIIDETICDFLKRYNMYLEKKEQQIMIITKEIKMEKRKINKDIMTKKSQEFKQLLDFKKWFNINIL